MKSCLLLALPTLALAACSLAGLGQTRPGWEAAVWFAATLWQESRSVRLPGLGFFSCATVFWLPLALHPQGGPALACVCLLTGLSLRTLLGGAPDPAQKCLEGLTELLPCTAALAAIAWLRGHPLAAEPWLVQAGCAALVYLLLSLLCQQLLTQELPASSRDHQTETRSRLQGLAQVSCLAGAGLAWVAQHNTWAALLLAVLGLQLPRLAQALLESKEGAERGNLMRQMERQQKEQRVLEVASQTLVQVRTLTQTAQELISLCHQLCQAQSVGVFLWREGRLFPAAWHTPHGQIMEQAGASGILADSLQPQRLCPDETQVLALPLGNFGMLYLGRLQPAFHPNEIRFLRQAASQGGLALQIASHMESLQQALQQQASISQQLQVWTTTLNQLMFFSVELSERLEASTLQEKLLQAASALVAHDALEVHLGCPADPLSQAVVQSRTPTYLEKVSNSSWQPFQPELESLLYVPILHPDLAEAGLIRVGARLPQAFTRLQHDALCLLASLGAVAWKNLDLRRQQLQAQGQMAQSAKLAAVGQLAAGIAHEMNTPLGSVNLNIDMALRSLEKSPPEAEKRLLRSKEMLAQTREIIEKLLLFSRQSSQPEQQDRPSPGDLNGLVQQTLQLFGNSLGLEGLKVCWSPTEGLPAVPLLNNPVQQVVLNLLLNARDAVLAGPSRSREIRLATAVAEGGVVLSVSDDGPGLDQATAQRIFDPFFTAEPVGQVPGLGLSVARQIAEAHRGHLTVESQPGQGARFCLWLPLACQDAQSLSPSP